MKYIICAAATVLALCASTAQAAIELTSFNVTSHTSGPGLLVNASPNTGGPTSLALNNSGDSVVVDLFTIWTSETSVNAGEDTAPQGINVAFNFAFGSSTFSQVVSGQTYGIAGVFLFVPFGAGVVDWATPVDVLFGAGNAGKLRIEFLDQLFNANFGYGNLAPGQSNGASVKAKFTLVGNLPPLPVEPGNLNAPEPAAMAVWAGLGIASAVGGWRCRRFAV